MATNFSRKNNLKTGHLIIKKDYFVTFLYCISERTILSITKKMRQVNTVDISKISS